MLVSVITKGGIGGGTDGGVSIGTNEVPDELTQLIRDLRLCTKDWSTTGFTSLYSF